LVGVLHFNGHPDDPLCGLWTV